MRKTLLSICVLLSMVMAVNAADYVVTSSKDLGDKVAAAVDGDVIILGQSDSILSQTALLVSKHIVIKAAAGLSTKPQLKLGIVLKNGSSVSIQGVKFFYDKPGSGTNSDSKYAISAVTEVAAIDSIVMRDCDISNFGRGVIRADNTTNIATIGKVIVDNCVINNASSVSNGYATLGMKTAKVSAITVRNSTFIGGLGAVIYSEDTTTPLNLSVDHVTIYNCGKTTTKPLIGFKNPTGSKFSVTNSIIYFSGITTAVSDTMTNRPISFSSATPDAASFTLNNSIVCSNQFKSKLMSLINPASDNAAWATYNTVTVDSVKMDANYVVTTYPTQLTGIGDPRGYKIKQGLQTLSNSTIIIYTGSEIRLSEPQQVAVYSVTGNLLLSDKNVTSLSVSKLQKGAYIVKAGGSVQKFIVR
jgi:hypothetical protein